MFACVRLRASIVWEMEEAEIRSPLKKPLEPKCRTMVFIEVVVVAIQCYSKFRLLLVTVYNKKCAVIVVIIVSE